MKWESEAQARQEIRELVTAYYHEYKENKTPFRPGDRVTYAARVFDEKEMCSLVDSALDFWLTTGRFAEAGVWQMARGQICPSGEQRFLRQPDRLYRPHRPGAGGAPDQAGG